MWKRCFYLVIFIVVAAIVSLLSPATAAERMEVASLSSKEITVKRGDSLYAISRKYKVSTRKIIKANKLKKPYHLLKGQKLIIPTKKYHKVKKGDTLYKIASRNGLSMTNLAKANSLKKPYRLVIGQKITIPDSKTRSKSIRTAKRTASKKKNTKPRNSLSNRQINKNIKRISKQKGKVKFRWPVKGKLLTKFGPMGNGVYSDGINISAPEGKKVKASADGVVVYIGKNLKGYGNLVIIRHRGGWLTAYAHQKNILTTKGKIVKRGQTIGEVGSTGNVERPQLHFAIRKGSKARDPLKLISS